MRAIWALMLVAGCASANSGELANGPGAGSGLPSEATSGAAHAPESSLGAASAAGTGTAGTPTGGVVSIGQIVAPKSFDPNPVLLTMKPKLIECYNKARASNPTLRGKLKLTVQVKDSGTVTNVEGDPGDPAFDPTLVVCLGDALRTTTFPSPGGTATITVPLVFHP